MAANEIEIADLQRLAASESPDLADAVVAFLAQPDPTPERPPPPDAILPGALPGLLAASVSRWDPKAAKRKAKRQVWQNFLTQVDPPLPPRFQLGDVLVDLYERGTDAGRAALRDVALRAPLRLGFWAGFKRIYKLAEARHDAGMFGALAARIDLEMTRPGAGREVGDGTLLYLARRAWRYLRQLGAALPELYPQFAVELLRSYPADCRFDATWAAQHVFAHGSKRYGAQGFRGRLGDNLVKHRAYADAWKRKPDPLLYLLETCQADAPARFAIQSLRQDFAATLRSASPAWLARLARRPLASVHEFLVETLQASPEFHQDRLAAVGLRDTVLSLLQSPSAKARAYAIEYARAHAQDLDATRLAELLETAPADTKAMAAAMLTARDPRALGYALLGRILISRDAAARPAVEWAQKCLEQSFEPRELPDGFLRDMLYGAEGQRGFVTGYIKLKYPGGELGPGFWTAALDDPRQKDNAAATQLAVAALARYPVATIGTPWLLAALTREGLGPHVAQWLRKADALPGLDIEKLKGLVFHPAHRAVALEILGNGKLVRPRDLSLPWLLALARRADPSLHDFAHRYLLEHMKPADFSDGGEREAGIARLFALATGEKEPEPVRVFAQTYLRCHHPVVGPEQAESKSLQLKPQLPAAAYTPERIWPSMWDPRADVRRFGVAIARADLRRWGYLGRVYELAESEAREVRAVAYDALLNAGDASADAACTLRPEELDAERVVGLTESRRRPTRDVGMELVRRHYARVGGPGRLAWLMESPDREVRLFAVQLLWEKHRPRALPPGWKPAGKSVALPGEAAAFDDVDALRGFLRRILFGVPPGRSMEARDEGGPRRRLPASVAKRNVIDVVRELGLRDEAFARVIAPVLAEFTGSLARGEWQACLTALVQLRRVHPGLGAAGVL